MTTISLEIEEKLASRLEALVQRLELDKDALIREALLEKIEELEDDQIVTERLSRPYKTVPHD